MLPMANARGFSRPVGKQYRASAPTATGSALRDGHARPEADDTDSLTDLRQWVHGKTDTVGDAPERR
jgi:hypothetical protein